jgi:hypothetical protein
MGVLSSFFFVANFRQATTCPKDFLEKKNKAQIRHILRESSLISPYLDYSFVYVAII